MAAAKAKRTRIATLQEINQSLLVIEGECVGGISLTIVSSLSVTHCS